MSSWEPVPNIFRHTGVQEEEKHNSGCTTAHCMQWLDKVMVHACVWPDCGWDCTTCHRINSQRRKANHMQQLSSLSRWFRETNYLEWVDGWMHIIIIFRRHEVKPGRKPKKPLTVLHCSRSRCVEFPDSWATGFRQLYLVLRIQRFHWHEAKKNILVQH